MFGYNVAYDLILEVLKGEPRIREALVNELLKLPVNEKVLRFPGGTPSRTWTYNEEDMGLWIQFCKDAGVEKLTYVWNISDYVSALTGLIELSKALEVVCIEVGNEENYHQRATGFFAGIVDSNSFLAERHYRPRGQKYGLEYNAVKNLCAQYGFNIPVAAVFGTPNALAHKFWNIGVEDVANVNDIVIHDYRKFSDKNFMQNFKPAMETLSNKKWWFTEINMSYEGGKYYYKRFTAEHQFKLQEYLNWVSNRQEISSIQIHSLYKHNGFGRFVWLNDILVDNYPNWF